MKLILISITLSISTFFLTAPNVSADCYCALYYESTIITKDNKKYSGYIRIDEETQYRIRINKKTKDLILMPAELYGLVTTKRKVVEYQFSERSTRDLESDFKRYIENTEDIISLYMLFRFKENEYVNLGAYYSNTKETLRIKASNIKKIIVAGKIISDIYITFLELSDKEFQLIHNIKPSGIFYIYDETNMTSYHFISYNPKYNTNKLKKVVEKYWKKPDFSSYPVYHFLDQKKWVVWNGVKKDLKANNILIFAIGE